MNTALRIKQLLRNDSLRFKLLRGGAGSVFVKLSFIGLGLAHSIVLARVLGPSDYGVFAYVYSIIIMLAIPAMFGLPQLVIRETANGHADGTWREVHGLWRWTTMVACVLSVGFIGLSIIGLWLWPDTFSNMQVQTFLWGLALLPLLALTRLTGSVLRGLRYVVQGQLPGTVIHPALFLFLLVTVLFMEGQLTPDNAMMLRVVAVLGAFAAGLWLLMRKQAAFTARRAKPVYKARIWTYSALPMAFAASLQIINQRIGIVMLGFFESSGTVGIYRVATQGAVLTAVGLQAVGMVVAPYFARIYEEGDHERLQRLVRTSIRGICLITFPVAAIFIFFGEPILQLVFGNGYTAAATPLAILCMGQIVNAMFGNVGFLLNMTGNEKITAQGVGMAASSNIVLNIALIPVWGANGAAAATALSFVVWNLYLARAVRVRISVRAFAI